MAKRGLHPALQQRAVAVKQAHDTLKSDPAYQQLSPSEKLRATQAHVNSQSKKS